MRTLHRRGPLRSWSAERLLELGRGYQPAALCAAAAELNLFQALADGPRKAVELASRLRCDARGLTVLLDALAALRLVRKRTDRYGLPAAAAPLLTEPSPRSILAMARHQANCLRKWARLAEVVKTGQPAAPEPSVRGRSGDIAAFIEAMHNVSAPVARRVIRAIRPLRFRHLLDLGGASGTWTCAFLRACPSGRATLFDLPQVIPMARRRLAAEGLARRVRLVPGDYLVDPLPSGLDLAWVSAIVHQNSRAQNRALFRKTFQALVPGGRLAIRDVLMEPNRVHPVAGALFAVHMLVATEGGGTFTFRELREDLQSAGFARVDRAQTDLGMNSVVVAEKPALRPLRRRGGSGGRSPGRGRDPHR